VGFADEYLTTYLPHAAWTNLAVAGAPKSEAVSLLGALSEMASMVFGTPSAHDPFRPNNHATPSISNTTQ
jgi:hypothetical protein